MNMMRLTTIALTLFAVGDAILLGAEPAPAKADDASARIFDAATPLTVHLKLDEQQWRAMQAVRPRDTGPPRDGRPRPPMRMEFPWGGGDIEVNDLACGNVGLRFKGNSTFRASESGLKRSFKVDFNRFVSGQKLLGLTALNLNNNALDPSQMREWLAYAVSREAGVPASRATQARVYLSIPGRYDRRHLGLYTVIEEVDKRFLTRWFGNSKGLLLKPEGGRMLPYLGDDPAAYTDRYCPKTDGTEYTWRRLTEFLKLLHRADDRTFAAEVSSYLEMDEFLRFVAVNSMLANLDSFLGTGHNFYMYVHPETGRIRWIQWDLNEAFGGFVVAGSPEAQAAMSVLRPWAGENRLIERVLAVESLRQRYREIVAELAKTAFDPQRLRRLIDAQEKAVEQALADERRMRGDGPQRGGPGLELMRRKPDLREFVTARAQAISAQLDGRSEGVVLQWRGPGPGPGGGPRPGGDGPRPPRPPMPPPF